MRRQLTHRETKNCQIQFPPVVVCESVNSPGNIGMIFRVCEAMGVERVFFCGDDSWQGNSKTLRAARATQDSLDWECQQEIIPVLDQLIARGYTISALEITNDSIDLRECRFADKEKQVFVIGAENYGVSEAVLERVHNAVHIPMFGSNSSMNVVTALSVCLFEYVRQTNALK